MVRIRLFSPIAIIVCIKAEQDLRKAGFRESGSLDQLFQTLRKRADVECILCKYIYIVLFLP